MDIYQLEVFVSVYEQKSFSRASEVLNITQPSVSAHIKKLEGELEVKLFDRTGRKTVATSEGEVLYQRAGEIIEKLKNIKADIGGQSVVSGGPLTIGASSLPGAYILPPLAASFRVQNPDVNFNIKIEQSDEITQMILNSELHLGIVDDMGNHDDIKCLHMIDDELILVAAPGFIGKKTISPLSLLSIPLVVREEGSESMASMKKQHLMNRIGLKVLNIAATLGSPESIKTAVKSGIGAALLSRHAVKDELESGILEVAKIKGVRMKRKFYVIANKKRTMPREYKVFIEYLMKHIQ